MRVCLVMKTAALRERPFALKKPRTIIGRSVRSDLRVPLPSVEAQHCELCVHGDRLTVTDLGSVAGVYRNGERVNHAVLSHDDELTIGPVTFQVRIGTNGSVVESQAEEMKEARDAMIESRSPTKSPRPSAN